MDPGIQKSLKAVFKINSVITGDDALYIKKENISKLTALLNVVNTAMVENKVYQYFTENKELEYKEHSARKAAIFNAFFAIKDALSGIYNKNNNSINLHSLIESFKSSRKQKSAREQPEDALP